MYGYPVRRKMKHTVINVIYLLSLSTSLLAHPRAFDVSFKHSDRNSDDGIDNNIIDFDDEYSLKYDKKYKTVPWHSSESYNKDSYKYTIVKGDAVDTKKLDKNKTDKVKINTKTSTSAVKAENESTEFPEFSVIPLELVSTTENTLVSVVESTTEADLTVIPLSTTNRTYPEFEINPTITLPVSTQISEDYTSTTENVEVTTKVNVSENIDLISKSNLDVTITTPLSIENITISDVLAAETIHSNNTKLEVDNFFNDNITTEIIEKFTTLNNFPNETSSSTTIESINIFDESTESKEEDVPVFTELDAEEVDKIDVPEDYYDSKDILPTPAPKTDALSVIFGFAGSVVESMVESVAERVVPNWIYDIYKRMQKQNEALEAEKLRSREENGGLGQFGRGILKSISSGISGPLSQLMAGVKDIGSLDSDRGFVSSLASGVTSVANVANSVVDAFKDRVQAIYPGTMWCGDGHSAAARSGELGLFFFTDTCCRQHDACKIYIRAGETKYGLTNTGLFTRSHCSCDLKFRNCLRKTNSLVSAQIGLTYFNVLGPQCFRKAHPIVRCLRRTRITGQKCEEYELDYTKPKMWQWFDSETF
ncbi:unnamed protein product [Parnassius apollo]|uniref:Phospholipase A2 n=1 Tax=Parnassius apollo TaxID=110799 RepID=A0A8S3XAL5_PARAO|nr:unnamed protein product [Parnassius apollo]